MTVCKVWDGTAWQEIVGAQGPIGQRGSTWFTYTGAGTPPDGFSSYVATIMADGPVAYWRLDEPSGTTALDQMGEHPLTYAATGVTLDQAGAISDGDPAVTFDGANGNAGTASSIALPGPDFTIEGWTYLTNATVANYCFMSAGTSQVAAMLRIMVQPSTVRPGIAVSGQAEVWANMPTPSNVNTWIHLALVKQGATATMYRNGVSVGTLTGLNNAICYVDEIGKQATLYAFQGSIDEVAVYTHALTAAQVLAHYDARTLTNTVAEQDGDIAVRANDGEAFKRTVGVWVDQGWKTTGTVYDTDSVGTVKAYSGATIPPNWMLADGRTLQRASYPDLFDALGGTSSPWGLPDVATFNIPDLRSRMLVGAGQGAALTNRALAGSGGEETHTLAKTEMPVHNHGGATTGGTTGGGATGGGTSGNTDTNHYHAFNVNSGYVNVDHSHGVTVTNLAQGNAALLTYSGGLSGHGSYTSPGVSNSGFQTGGISANHVHNVAGNTNWQSDQYATNNHSHSVPALSIPGLSVPALGIYNDGSGGAHENMPPWVAVGWIIKAVGVQIDSGGAIRGATGQRGSIYYNYTGTGTPAADTFIGELDGDFAIRSADGEMFKRVAGAWVDQSLHQKGTSWYQYTGTGTPATGTFGVGEIDGDWAVRQSDGEVFQRVSGAWVDRAMKQRAASWSMYTGVGTPAPGALSATEVDGDWAIRQSDGENFQRVGGAWVDQNFTNRSTAPVTTARAYLSANWTPPAAGDILVPLNTISYDTGGNFSTAGNRFVCPTTGYYQVNGCVTPAGAGSMAINTKLWKNGTTVTTGGGWAGNATNAGAEVMADIVFCNAGDYLQLVANFSATLIAVSSGPMLTWMSVALLTAGPGPQGQRGATWFTYTGTGTPAAGTFFGEIDGDMAVRTLDSEVFKRTSGAWVDQVYKVSAGIASSSTACRMYRAAAFTPSSANAWQKVVVDTASFDSQGTMASVANGQITVQAPGYYKIDGQVFFNTSATGTYTYVGVAIAKNGVNVAQNYSVPAIQSYGCATVSDTVYCNGGDYLELRCVNTQGTSMNCSASNNWLAVTMVTAGPGPQGQRGAQWWTYTGAGTPAAGIFGVNELDGDMAVRSSDGEVFKRISGAWVDQSYKMSQIAAFVQQTYTMTAGYTADRAMNPQATTLGEVATVLATLIDDLVTAGLVHP
jgi:microcystin-dependent protein